jgi:hypothetical protein
VQGDFATRRFTDEELRRILELATESELDARHAAAPAGGHTLAEIQEIGREVGIEPTSIENAAASLLASEQQDPRGSRIPRFSRTAHADLVLARTLSDGEMHQILQRAERILNRPGTVHVKGNWAQWRDRNDRVYVGIVRGTNHTRLRVIVDQTRELLFGGGLIGAVGLFTLPAATGFEGTGVALIALLIGLVAFGVFGLFWRWRTGAAQVQMDELLELLADAVA